MGSRRQQALVAGLVVLMAVLVMLSSPDAGQRDLDPRPSSFHAAPRGALALYLTLDRLGVPVERRLASWVDTELFEGALVLLAPGQPLTPAEVAGLTEWIEAGGVFFYGASPGDPLLGELGLAVAPVARGLEVRAARAEPHLWTEGVAEAPGFRWSFADTSRVLRDARAEVLLRTDGGAPLALGFRRGEGTVVAWSDVRPLGNAELRAGDAALLFARSAAALLPEGEPLVFDEYHHGYREGEGVVAATLTFLRHTGPGRLALQLGVVGLGLLLLHGRRFGAPHPPPPARRRSPLEHVEALAGAYRQRDARTTALRLLLAGTARRLGRTAPPTGMEDAWLEQLAGHAAPADPPAQALLDAWRQGGNVDLVILSRHADRLVAETRRH